MIDEKKLIEEIRNMVLPLTIPEIDDGTTLAYNEALVDVLNAIEEQPKVGKWIPVEERLPSEKGQYLVTFHPCYWDDVKSDVLVGIDNFMGKTSWSKRKHQRVIAWMPLPEPYVKGEKKNERL